MQRRLPFQIVRDVLLSASIAVLLVLGPRDEVQSPTVAPPRINGAYDLKGSGAGVVVGRAVVTSMRVRITGAMMDATGNLLAFSAPNLAIDTSTYRFKGTGTLGTSTAVVSGRLDPDDGTVKKCRITGQFVAADGNAGRISGEHR